MPGLDTPAAFARTGAVPVTDLARTYDRDQPVVVIDARTGRRQLIWAELDSNASTPADTALLIHPAENWTRGRIATSSPCATCAAPTAAAPAGPAFRRYRDGIHDRRPRLRAPPAAHGVALPDAEARRASRGAR